VGFRTDYSLCALRFGLSFSINLGYMCLTDYTEKYFNFLGKPIECAVSVDGVV